MLRGEGNKGGSQWLQQIPTDVRVVAETLGAVVGQRRSGVQCPACREEHRGKEDRRAPAIWCANYQGWHCQRCDAKGNAIQFLTYWLYGSILPAGDPRWAEVKNYATTAKWVEESRFSKADDPPEGTYIPETDIQRFWQDCLPVDKAARDEGSVGLFFEQRGWSGLLRTMAAEDLCRITPVRMSLPTWWRSPWLSQWRLVVRAWAPDGRAAGIQGRAIGERMPNTPKVRWHWAEGTDTTPPRWRSSGLLFACKLGQNLIQRKPLPPVDAVIVTEGVTDFCMMAAQAAEWSRRDRNLIVLGGASGSWSGLATLPFPADVLIATDPDKGGELHAEQIRQYVAMAVR